MLMEDIHVRQVSGEPRRRWFSDENFDLIVWFQEDSHVYGFQLCYDKQHKEKVFTWLSDRGFSHQNMNSGEEGPLANRTPVLGKTTKTFEADRVLNALRAVDAPLTDEVKHLVYEKISEFGTDGVSHGKRN